MTWYSTIPRLESRRSCWSIDQGSQLISRTTASQESSSAAVSHFTGSFSVPWRASSDMDQRYRSLDDSSGNRAPADPAAGAGRDQAAQGPPVQLAAAVSTRPGVSRRAAGPSVEVFDSTKACGGA